MRLRLSLELKIIEIDNYITRYPYSFWSGSGSLQNVVNHDTGIANMFITISSS